MASGNSLCSFVPQGCIQPTSNYATYDFRNNHLVLEFDAGTDESVIWADILPRNYSGGGLTVNVLWMGDGVTTGDVVWNGAFERNEDSGTDLDSDSFATAQAATGTTAGTNGAVQYTAITFTDGAQIDSIAVGERFRFKLTRDADNVADTMSADAQVLAVEIIET